MEAEEDTNASPPSLPSAAVETIHHHLAQPHTMQRG